MLNRHAAARRAIIHISALAWANYRRARHQPRDERTISMDRRNAPPAFPEPDLTARMTEVRAPGRPAEFESRNRQEVKA